MSLKTLVIDDSTTIQKIFKIALSKFDVDVSAVGSYLEAINQLRNRKADLLVVDANLPGVRVAADLQKLQAESNQAPVLLLIGSHESFDEQSFKVAGFKHYLRKPFEAQDIIKILGDVVGTQLVSKEKESAQSIPVTPGMGFTGQGAAVPPPPGFTRPPEFSHGYSQQMGPGLSQGAMAVSIPLPSDMDAELMSPPPPPISIANGNSIEVDQSRRGKKAFYEPQTNTGIGFASPGDELPETVIADMSIPVSTGWPTPPANTIAVSSVSMEQVDALKNKLEDFLRGEAPIVVRKAVEKYCEQHFAQLAREVITQELRRLAEEKARHLTN